MWPLLAVSTAAACSCARWCQTANELCRTGRRQALWLLFATLCHVCSPSYPTKLKTEKVVVVLFNTLSLFNFWLARSIRQSQCISLQKRLNRAICRLGSGLNWAKDAEVHSYSPGGSNAVCLKTARHRRTLEIDARCHRPMTNVAGIRHRLMTLKWAN